MQSYAAKQPDEQAKDTTSDEQAKELLSRLADPEGIEFWTFLKQHKNMIMTMVNTYHADGWPNQQQATAEKKELTRLRRLVKDYFAEFFLASMYLIGMFLAVIYMLAHTWR
jgi:hypothetical protein